MLACLYIGVGLPARYQPFFASNQNHFLKTNLASIKTPSPVDLIGRDGIAESRRLFFFRHYVLVLSGDRYVSKNNEKSFQKQNQALIE